MENQEAVTLEAGDLSAVVDVPPMNAVVRVNPLTGYPIEIPDVLDIDPDIHPLVAMDLSAVQWLYDKYKDEQTYTWEELRPRVIRRLNRKYGIEDT